MQVAVVPHLEPALKTLSESNRSHKEALPWREAKPKVRLTSQLHSGSRLDAPLRLVRIVSSGVIQMTAPTCARQEPCDMASDVRHPLLLSPSFLTAPAFSLV